MKHTLLSLLLLLMVSTAMAADRGVLQPGVRYTDFAGGDEGTFTPDMDGTLTIQTYNNCLLSLYRGDYLLTGRYELATDSTPRIDAFQVKQGITYIIYNGTPGASADFQFALTSNEGVPFKMLSVDPANGSAISMTGAYAGQVNIGFNFEPAWNSITVSAGQVRRQVEATLGQNYTLYFETKEVVNEAIRLGLKPGDPIKVVVSGLCVADRKAVKYNNTGNLVLNYTLLSQPTTLNNAAIPATFCSYYRNSDPEGVAYLTFSEEITSGTVYLKHGNLDNAASGEYYSEDLSAQGKVKIEGKVMTIDLRGRSRTRQEMMPGVENRYDNMILHVAGVKDIHGQAVVSNGQGTVGSFTFTIPYKEITVDIATDFTPNPENVTSLAGVANLEVYVTDYDKFSFTGVRFTGDGFDQVVPVANIRQEAEGDGMVYYIPVPEAAKTAVWVKVGFEGLEFADGNDHSADFQVTYGQTDASAKSLL